MSHRKSYALRSYLSYLGRFKPQFAIIFLSFMTANILLAVVPLFIGKLIGSLASQPIDHHAVMISVIVLIACSTIHDVLWHVGELLYMKLFSPLSYDYEGLLFRQVITKPYPYFVGKFTGKISSYITTLSQELRDQTEKIFWDYAQHLVSLITVCIILTAVNLRSGLIFVGGLLLMFVVGRKTVRNSIKYEKVWTDVQSTKNGKIIDAIANFVNIKSFQKEGRETQTIRHEQAMTLKAANRSFLWAVVFWGSMGFIVRNIIWPATIILNVYWYLHHELSLADLTTFLSAALLFTTYIWDIIWSVSQFSLKLARMEEAHQYLFGDLNITKAYFDDQALQPVTRTLDKELAFRNLSFAYPDQADVPVLKDISLQIKKGEKIGIVGKSGSGKTTLTKLLLDYYPVEDGHILLDGEVVTIHDLARLIAYVPQDTALFHRSIADNIAYATDREVSREEIVKAAKQAHAHEFIDQISEGYEALVGERGVKLSAGQRQRIAIARAFLDDKPILVLDEATSALDSESEVLVQEALEALWEHKTVIAIAHRLSTLRHMDTIVVIKDGTILEKGSHSELLAKNGSYAKLWAHQSGGFLEDSD